MVPKEASQLINQIRKWRGAPGGMQNFKRATDEGSLPEIAQYSPYYLPLNVFTASKGLNLYILFSVTSKGEKSAKFALPSVWMKTILRRAGKDRFIIFDF